MVKSTSEVRKDKEVAAKQAKEVFNKMAYYQGQIKKNTILLLKSIKEIDDYKNYTGIVTPRRDVIKGYINFNGKINKLLNEVSDISNDRVGRDR